MLDLSPTKILIVLIVAVVLLGPKRLPRVARELGAGWRKIRELHSRVDADLRESMPDLPTTQEIVHFARSPITMLNRLATLDDPEGARADDAVRRRADDGGDLDEAGPYDGADDEDVETAAYDDVDADEDAAFTDAAFTETGVEDAPGRAGRPPRDDIGARRPPRLVSLAPLSPVSPTDDPNLN